jgi:hypothetical protein
MDSLPLRTRTVIADRLEGLRNNEVTVLPEHFVIGLVLLITRVQLPLGHGVDLLLLIEYQAQVFHYFLRFVVGLVDTR